MPYPTYNPRKFPPIPYPRYVPPQLRDQQEFEIEEAKRRAQEPPVYPGYWPQRPVETVTPQELAENPLPDTAAPAGFVSETPNPPTTRAEALARLMDTRAVDRNGRLRSGGLAALTSPVQPTNSWGNLIGQKIGNFFGGMIRPQRDEEIELEREIQRETRAAKAEEAAAEARRQREAHTADVEYKRAATKNVASMPGYRSEEQRRKDEDLREKAKDRDRAILASIYNKLPDFDPQDPENADMVRTMREQGLPVVEKKRGQQLRFVHDAQTGGWTVMAGDKTTGEAVSSQVTAPGGEGQLTTTSPQAMIRQSVERIAKWQIGSREKIAAANQTIQRERNKLTADQFAKRYPGAGKEISEKDLAERAIRQQREPEALADDAIRQGYVIVP